MKNPRPDSLSRLQNLYSEADRDIIYDGFEKYQRFLAESPGKDYDIMDAVDQIWTRARRWKKAKLKSFKQAQKRRSKGISSASSRNMWGQNGEVVGVEDVVDKYCENDCETQGRFSGEESRGETDLRGYKGRAVSSILCDESQDLVLKQLLLFSIVCEDIEGYTFAADPAQCIAHGRNFRLASIWILIFLFNYQYMVHCNIQLL